MNLNLCKNERRDRLFFNGYAGNGLVGSIRAYSDSNYQHFLLYEYDESLTTKYSKKIHTLLEYLQSFFGRPISCEKERRLYSRSPILEYGYHFKDDDQLSYYVRVNENGEFMVYVYDMEVNNG